MEFTKPKVVDAEIVKSPVVLVESPYRDGDRRRNLRYLAWCESDASVLGELPIASHGNCTAYWPEDDEHRAKGFAWRDIVRKFCDYVVSYVDLGTSEGQRSAQQRDVRARVPGEWVERRLPSHLMVKFNVGEYPPGSMRRVPAEHLGRDFVSMFRG